MLRDNNVDFFKQFDDGIDKNGFVLGTLKFGIFEKIWVDPYPSFVLGGYSDHRRADFKPSILFVQFLKPFKTL